MFRSVTAGTGGVPGVDPWNPKSLRTGLKGLQWTPEEMKHETIGS